MEEFDSEMCYYVFAELYTAWRYGGHSDEMADAYQLLNALRVLSNAYAKLSHGDNAEERYEREEYSS